MSREVVTSEFNQLLRHDEYSKSCEQCKKYGIPCVHPELNVCAKFKSMTQKRTLKPFIMVVILQLFMQFSGMSAMRPYFVPVLRAYGMPLDPNSITVIIGFLGILAITLLLLTIHSFGKRSIFLLSMFASVVTYFALSNC